MVKTSGASGGREPKIGLPDCYPKVYLSELRTYPVLGGIIKYLIEDWVLIAEGRYLSETQLPFINLVICWHLFLPLVKEMNTDNRRYLDYIKVVHTLDLEDGVWRMTMVKGRSRTIVIVVQAKKEIISKEFNLSFSLPRKL